MSNTHKNQGQFIIIAINLCLLAMKIVKGIVHSLAMKCSWYLNVLLLTICLHEGLKLFYVNLKLEVRRIGIKYV